MDQVTQQNAAMVEESTAASHSLASEAEELATLVSHFEIGQAAPQARATRAPAHKPKPVVKHEPAHAPTRGALALKPRVEADEDDWKDF
jgi:methyl-accepting chemotaxis protein